MRRILKAAVLCGIIGPIIFAGALITLSILERGFMFTLGWNPLTAPTRDWPSGLALGQWGFVMTAVFIACGLLLVIFALGLRRVFAADPAGSIASIFLALAGLAMSFLAFSTDPTNPLAPATVHGRIHDAAFVFLGISLFASLAAFGLVFRGKEKWRANAVISWVTAALIVPAFIVKGFAFYVFLAAFLAWSEAAAIQLLRRMR